MDRNPLVAYPISINWCRLFRMYDLPNAGNCNYGNFDDLPEIHQRKAVGLSLTGFSLACSEWGAGKESVCVWGVICFRILL